MTALVPSLGGISETIDITTFFPLLPQVAIFEGHGEQVERILLIITM